jgi:SAM-dependent methyltransferase
MRPLSTCVSLLLSVGVLTLASCQAPSRNSVETTSFQLPSAEPVAIAADHSPANTGGPTAPTSEEDHSRHQLDPAPEAANGTAPNRDLHGPRDTALYVEMLQSDTRIRELKPELVAQNLFEHAGLSRDSVIADIGCGPGIFVWPFAKLIPDGFLFAVDVEPAQLDALREGLLARKVENVVPVLASYSTPHLPVASCDAIFIADTYHHFEDRAAYMALLRRRLAPGGYLVLLEYKDGDLPVGPPAKHKVLKEVRHAKLVSAGFELDRELSTHIFHDFEFWRLRRAGQ